MSSDDFDGEATLRHVEEGHIITEPQPSGLNEALSSRLQEIKARVKHSSKPTSPSSKQASDFVRNLRREAQIRHERVETLQRQEMERRAMELEAETRIDKEKRNELQVLRAVQIEERLDEIKRRKEERERKHLEWITSMKQMKTPLYQKMGESYEQRVVLP